MISSLNLFETRLKLFNELKDAVPTRSLSYAEHRVLQRTLRDREQGLVLPELFGVFDNLSEASLPVNVNVKVLEGALAR